MTETVNVIPKGARLATSDQPNTGLEQTVAIEDVIFGDRYRKDDGDLTDLIESINDIGLINPIILTPSFKLISGGRRIAAYRELGLTHIQARVTEQFSDLLASVKAELDENTCRKPMTTSELLALGHRIEQEEKPRARQRISEAGERGRDTRYKSGPATLVAGPAGRPNRPNRTTDFVAKAIGMSTVGYERASVVARAATTAMNDDVRQEAIAQLARLDAGTATITGAYNAVAAKKRDVKEIVHESTDDATPMPAKRLVRRGVRGKTQLDQLMSIKAVIDGYIGIADRMTSEAETVGFDASLHTDEAAQQVDSLIGSARALTRTLNTLRKETTK